MSSCSISLERPRSANEHTNRLTRSDALGVKFLQRRLVSDGYSTCRTRVALQIISWKAHSSTEDQREVKGSAGWDMRLNQSPTRELRVLDYGYTDQVQLD